MPDIITIPALYADQRDATLIVESDAYGDSYTMRLERHDGHVIAEASGFRPGAATDFGEGHERETADTFGAFLANALEDAEAAEDWTVISEDASDWTDALTLYGMEGEAE